MRSRSLSWRNYCACSRPRCLQRGDTCCPSSSSTTLLLRKTSSTCPHRQRPFLRALSLRETKGNFPFHRPNPVNKHSSKMRASSRLPLFPLRTSKNELPLSSGSAMRWPTTSHQTRGRRSLRLRSSPTSALSTPSRPPSPALTLPRLIYIASRPWSSSSCPMYRPPPHLPARPLPRAAASTYNARPAPRARPPALRRPSHQLCLLPRPPMRPARSVNT